MSSSGQRPAQPRPAPPALPAQAMRVWDVAGTRRLRIPYPTLPPASQHNASPPLPDLPAATHGCACMRDGQRPCAAHRGARLSSHPPPLPCWAPAPPLPPGKPEHPNCRMPLPTGEWLDLHALHEAYVSVSGKHGSLTGDEERTQLAARLEVHGRGNNGSRPAQWADCELALNTALQGFNEFMELKVRACGGWGRGGPPDTCGVVRARPPCLHGARSASPPRRCPPAPICSILSLAPAACAPPLPRRCTAPWGAAGRAMPTWPRQGREWEAGALPNCPAAVHARLPGWPVQGRVACTPARCDSTHAQRESNPPHPILLRNALAIAGGGVC